MAIKTRGINFKTYKGLLIIGASDSKPYAEAIASDRRDAGYKNVRVIRAFHLDKLHGKKMYQVVGRYG